MYASQGKYILERGLPMERIITKIYDLLKDTDSLIEFEEQLQLYMYETCASLVETVFSQINDVVKKQKQEEEWKVERNDPRSIQFTFGNVYFKRTLMYDEKGKPHYPLDDWLGIRKHQRYSPLVEFKVAELASESTYREVANILEEWTAVEMTHTTVGGMLKRVGNAQAEADKEMVQELEEAASLPKGKKIDFLYTEADGVFVRGLEKKKHIEVSHGILYEGWNVNGKRVSLKNQQVIMTTQPIDHFWDEVQTVAAHEYSLENTQIVSNSDGGAGYSADRFQSAFSQSNLPPLHQLDGYHIGQAINRTFGFKKSDLKSGVKDALDMCDLNNFKLYLDTYESTLNEDKEIEKVQKFRTYILNHWDFIEDWRERIDDPPQGARRLGAMESNQRRISFRMKKRGMHWSKEVAEAIVKVKQGMLNDTLREVYLASQKRSTRKQREVKKVVRMSYYLSGPKGPSDNARQASVNLNAAHSSAVGRLVKSLR